MVYEVYKWRKAPCLCSMSVVLAGRHAGVRVARAATMQRSLLAVLLSVAFGSEDACHSLDKTQQRAYHSACPLQTWWDRAAPHLALDANETFTYVSVGVHLPHASPAPSF